MFRRPTPSPYERGHDAGREYLPRIASDSWWNRERWAFEGKDRAAGVYIAQGKRDVYLQGWIDAGKDAFK